MLAGENNRQISQRIQQVKFHFNSNPKKAVKSSDYG